MAGGEYNDFEALKTWRDTYAACNGIEILSHICRDENTGVLCL